MAGHCVARLPCKKCGSKDNVQVFKNDENYSGYCFGCKTYYPDPYNGEVPTEKPRLVRTQEQVGEELSSISQLKTFALPDRKLRAESLEYFGIKVECSEETGLPVICYYPYTKDGQVTGYHARIIDPKKPWMIGDVDSVELFGWQQALATGAKRLYVTEGGFDTVALYQALKEKERGTEYASFNPAVVSLTRGAGGAAKDFATNLDKIKKNFKDVILVFDQDEPGRKAVEDVLKILPTCQTVTLPCKDANQCLIDGRQQALCNAVLFKAEVPKNTKIVNASTLFDAARTQAKWGLSWPWEGMTKLTKGMRFGETYYIGAPVKSGKSTIADAIAAHCITVHDLPVFMAKPEQDNKRTVQGVLGAVANRIFYDPEITFDFDGYDKAASEVADKLRLLDLYQHLGWSSLKNDIAVAAHNGCKVVFIDPITNLSNGVESGKANTLLQEIAQELSAMAKDLGLIIFIFCHLNNPDSGPPHELGGRVLSSQFAGSRAMARSCDLMIGLEANKDPDIEEGLRNMRRLVILEDRTFGNTGICRLWYDKETGSYNEVKDA